MKVKNDHDVISQRSRGSQGLNCESKEKEKEREHGAKMVVKWFSIPVIDPVFNIFVLNLGEIYVWQK